MLLSLNASSLRSLLHPPAKGAAATVGRMPLALGDLPQFIRDEFDLSGMSLDTTMLAGMDTRALEKLRERADRAGCACLLLREVEALPLGASDGGASDRALDRLQRVVRAGHLLGCNAVAFTPSAGPDPDELDFVAEACRRAMAMAERYEMNILISPKAGGIVATADQVSDLLKRIGGFRIGTLPDFQYASTFDDPAGFMRRLSPYAAAVSASTIEFLATAEDELIEPAEMEAPQRKDKGKSKTKDRPDSEPAKGKAAAGKRAEARVPEDALRASIAEALAASASNAEAKGGKKRKAGGGKGVAEEAIEEGAKARSRGSPAVGSEAGPEAGPEVGPRGGSAKKSAGTKKASAETDVEDEPEVDLDEAELEDEGDSPMLGESELAALDAMLSSLGGGPAPEHRPYDLRPLVAAVLAVGFDNALVIDYRGAGDVVEGVRQSIVALEAAIAQERQRAS